MQKMLFASAAIASVMALGTLASPKVEAAPAGPAAMVQTSPSLLLSVRHWRDRRHRDDWPVWQQRRHRNDYDRYDRDRGDRHGYRYQRSHSNRGLVREGFRALSDD